MSPIDDHVAPRPSLEPFEHFYHREYRQVFGLAVVLCRNRNIAEDLTQDAMLEAHRRWEKIGRYDDPGAWVRRVLCNKSHSRFRRLASETKALTRLSGRRVEALSTQPETDEMFALVRSLPTRQAQAIALRYWEDRSVKQIAEILECGEETVKTHLKRGLAKLKALVDEPLGGEQ